MQLNFLNKFSKRQIVSFVLVITLLLGSLFYLAYNQFKADYTGSLKVSGTIFDSKTGNVLSDTSIVFSSSKTELKLTPIITKTTSGGGFNLLSPLSSNYDHIYIERDEYIGMEGSISLLPSNSKSSSVYLTLALDPGYGKKDVHIQTILPGKNLISSPLIPKDSNPQNFFGYYSFDGKLTKSSFPVINNNLYYFDNTLQKTIFYDQSKKDFTSNGKTNQGLKNFSITQGQGYWLISKDKSVRTVVMEGTLVYGDQTNINIPKAGGAEIGIPSTSSAKFQDFVITKDKGAKTEETKSFAQAVKDSWIKNQVNIFDPLKQSSLLRPFSSEFTDILTPGNAYQITTNQPNLILSDSNFPSKDEAVELPSSVTYDDVMLANEDYLTLSKSEKTRYINTKISIDMVSGLAQLKPNSSKKEQGQSLDSQELPFKLNGKIISPDLDKYKNSLKQSKKAVFGIQKAKAENPSLLDIQFISQQEIDDLKIKYDKLGEVIKSTPMQVIESKDNENIDKCSAVLNDYSIKVDQILNKNYPDIDFRLSPTWLLNEAMFHSELCTLVKIDQYDKTPMEKFKSLLLEYLKSTQSFQPFSDYDKCFLTNGDIKYCPDPAKAGFAPEPNGKSLKWAMEEINKIYGAPTNFEFKYTDNLAITNNAKRAVKLKKVNSEDFQYSGCYYYLTNELIINTKMTEKNSKEFFWFLVTHELTHAFDDDLMTALTVALTNQEKTSMIPSSSWIEGSAEFVANKIFGYGLDNRIDDKAVFDYPIETFPDINYYDWGGSFLSTPYLYTISQITHRKIYEYDNKFYINFRKWLNDSTLKNTISSSVWGRDPGDDISSERLLRDFTEEMKRSNPSYELPKIEGENFLDWFKKQILFHEEATSPIQLFAYPYGNNNFPLNESNENEGYQIGYDKKIDANYFDLYKESLLKNPFLKLVNYNTANNSIYSSNIVSGVPLLDSSWDKRRQFIPNNEIPQKPKNLDSYRQLFIYNDGQTVLINNTFSSSQKDLPAAGKRGIYGNVNLSDTSLSGKISLQCTKCYLSKNENLQIAANNIPVENGFFRVNNFTSLDSKKTNYPSTDVNGIIKWQYINGNITKTGEFVKLGLDYYLNIKDDALSPKFVQAPEIKKNDQSQQTISFQSDKPASSFLAYHKTKEDGKDVVRPTNLYFGKEIDSGDIHDLDQISDKKRSVDLSDNTEFAYNSEYSGKIWIVDIAGNYSFSKDFTFKILKPISIIDISSSPSADCTSASASIYWKTSVETTGSVEMNGNSYPATKTGDTYKVALSGLSYSTAYTYKIKAISKDGTINNSGDQTFTIPKKPDSCGGGSGGGSGSGSSGSTSNTGDHNKLSCSSVGQKWPLTRGNGSYSYNETKLDNGTTQIIRCDNDSNKISVQILDQLIWLQSLGNCNKSLEKLKAKYGSNMKEIVDWFKQFANIQITKDDICDGYWGNSNTRLVTDISPGL